jgi:hypothetical protein
MEEINSGEIAQFLKILGIKARILATEEIKSNMLINNSYFIFNTDDDLNKDSRGTHWTAFSLKNGICIYIDSFGNPPPSNITKMIHQKNYEICYNSIQVQHINSVSCGYYACYFLWSLNNDKKPYSTTRQATNRINKIVAPFDLDELENNDGILKGIINKMLK